MIAATLPAATCLIVDLAQRHEHFARFGLQHFGLYLLAWLECAVLWALLLIAATRSNRVGRALFCTLFLVTYTFCMGGQVYFFAQYRSYLNRDLSLFAANLVDSVFNQLLADAPDYVLSKLPFALLALFFLALARRWLTITGFIARHPALGGLGALLAACFIPTHHRQLQASTPDVLYLNALGAFVSSQLGLTDASGQVRPRARRSLPVKSVVGAPPTLRNVVFVVTESVRADAACSTYSATCKLTPYTNALFPDRVGLEQMRALDSTTAVSLAVLWAGVAPNESSEVLHTWPLLFDYADAAGWDTGYFTSQNLMFGNSRLWVKNLGARLFISGSELEPGADLDLGANEALLADYLEQQWPRLREPFLAIVHLSNTHYPYRVAEGAPTPFQPAEFDKGPDSVAQFRNYYQNAVVQQDMHLARALRHLKESPKGERTVVVYTSDHGEAFRDHHQLGHTFTLFDEEIKVPAFIDAPEALLTMEERRNLEAKQSALVFHVDVAPTVLDLMGLWHAPELQRFRTRMPGHSLLGPSVTERVLPMTNCAAVWSCAFENWGVMRGPIKLFARTPYDTGWQCHDVLADPTEQIRLNDPRCDALKRHAVAWFGNLPQ